jgi:hypothetical protein
LLPEKLPQSSFKDSAIQFCDPILRCNQEAIMSNIVSAEVMPARLLAAVRRQVRIGEVGAAWRPALDQVWAFLRHTSGLRTDGHNVFLYHHPASPEMPMNVDFGVQVTRSFERSGEVFPDRNAGRRGRDRCARWILRSNA